MGFSTQGSSLPKKSIRARVERLEPRRLMSGTWNTVDSLPASGASDYVKWMTSDSAGNLYAVGAYGTTGAVREKAVGSNGFEALTANVPIAGNTQFDSAGTDARGDLFVSSATDTSNGPQTSVLERAAGSQTFVPVNFAVPGNAILLTSGWEAFASDSAGDVFFINNMKVPTGTVTTGHGANTTTTTTYAAYGVLFEMAAGQSSFVPVYQASTSNFAPVAITLIETGPSAGLYVLDSNHWTVRKSTDGGASWTVVDDFHYDPNGGYNDGTGIAGDSSGNLFVVGLGQQRVLTGYTYTQVKGKLVANPVYNWYGHWLTRQSTDGGATWRTVDDYQQDPQSQSSAYQVADVNGTAYVVGHGGNDGIVRTNSSGSWQTADDLSGNPYYSVAIDPTTGAPYAGAGGSWTIRSAGAPASGSSTAFSSMLITTSNQTSSASGTSWLKTPDNLRLHNRQRERR